MAYEIKKLSSSQIEIRGEMQAKTIEDEYLKVLKSFASQTTLKGFRKGGAPLAIVEKHADEHTLLYQAATALLQKEYPNILREEKLETLGFPQITILKLARKNPLVWKAIVYVLPEDIQLPDYEKIAREILKQKTLPEINEEEIEKNIETLRKQKQRAENLKELPSLDDAFAKSLNVPSMDTLRETLRLQLTQHKMARQQDESRVKILHAIAEKVSVDLPQPMITLETEKLLDALKRQVEQSHMEWVTYLQSMKKSEVEMRKEMENEARNRVLFGIIIQTIAKKEQLIPTHEEIQNKLESLKIYFREDIDNERLSHYALDMVTSENVFSFLEKPQQ